MYLTDGVNLYEVIAEDYFPNAGCAHGDGGTILREAAIRDCVTMQTALVYGNALAKLTVVDTRKVCEMDEQPASKTGMT